MGYWFGGGLKPEDLGGYMVNATRCFAGAAGTDPACATAAQHWTFCVLTMLLSNLFQALLVKYSSALLSTLVITMVTPCSAFAFTFPSLMGSHAEDMSWILWLSLLVLVVGVLVYRTGDATWLRIKDHHRAWKDTARKGGHSRLQPPPIQQQQQQGWHKRRGRQC